MFFMIAELMPRVFEFNQGSDKPVIELPDPDAKASPETVKATYLTTYPLLATCTINGPIVKNDNKVFTFQLALGTKS